MVNLCVCRILSRPTLSLFEAAIAIRRASNHVRTVRRFVPCFNCSEESEAVRHYAVCDDRLLVPNRLHAWSMVLVAYIMGKQAHVTTMATRNDVVLVCFQQQ